MKIEFCGESFGGYKGYAPSSWMGKGEQFEAGNIEVVGNAIIHSDKEFHSGCVLLGCLYWLLSSLARV